MHTLDEVTGLRSEEARAAEILGVVLDGTVVPRDVAGAPEGSHDFDIHAGGKLIAVEVTRDVDEPSRADAGARQRADWTCPSLAGSWHLSHGPLLKVKALHNEVESLLGVLEAGDVRKFDSDEINALPDDARKAVTRLACLGIRRGASIGDFGDAATISFGSSTGGSTAPEVVNAAVEAAAGTKANKLAKAIAAEHHLFLWVDSTADQVNASMSFDVLPRVAPAIPDGIDVVWVAPGPYVESGPRLTGRLWKATADGGWVNIGEVKRREPLGGDSATV